MEMKIARDNVSARDADKRLRRLLADADFGNKYSSNMWTLENRLEILEDFMKAGGFEPIYYRAARDCQLPMKQGDVEHFTRYFAARVFEQIAYFFMLNSGVGLFTSPTETFEFYRWLYPNNQLRSNTLGFDSIRGVTVPDGLLVEKLHGLYKIIAVCEYTLTRDTEIFKHKFRSFKKIRRDFPAVFNVTQLVFLVPGGYNPPASLNNPDVAFEFAPFPNERLRDFAFMLFEKEGPLGQRSVKSLFESYKGKDTTKPYQASNTAATITHI